MRKMAQPQVKTDYFPLEGGLDLVSPAISIAAGKVIDSQNYEPDIAGKYRRIDGYERYDGTTPPTNTTFWMLTATITGSVSVGATVTGGTSGATGVVLGVFSGYLILGRVTGTFAASEILLVSAVNVGTVIATQAQNGANNPSDQADYTLLAANDRRQFINAVPGGGAVRGVWIYNDVLYAFRDNASATASVMWKATSSGWVQVTLQTELRFSAATAQIVIGATITGASSGATATVANALLMTGTWTSSGVGSLILTGVTGTFASGEAIKVSGTSYATASANSAQITLSPGGRRDFFNYNFTGSTNTAKMYGCDGVNPAFEFDGTIYSPIRTGMTTDAPSHLICHKGYLLLSFLASVQFSALTNPYNWSITLGAGEIECSDPVTGFLPQGGTVTGSSLAIFTKVRTFILYGTSVSDFKLVSSIFDIGYSAWTAQQVSNDAYGLTGRGVQSLITTLTYGDFDYESVSHMVQPIMTAKRGMETASNSIRTKNQYRVYFNDGSAMAVGLTGDKVSGILMLSYTHVVRCICTATLSNGSEVTYFGSDDGYVYQDNVGTSHDGATIESWCRLPFNHSGSPQIRKRFIKAILEMSVFGYTSLNVSYELGYGTSDVMQAAAIPNLQIPGAAQYWDQFTWDHFTFDSQVVGDPTVSIDGTAKNVGLIFYSNRAQDGAHTLQGVTLLYIPRRLDR